MRIEHEGFRVTINKGFIKVEEMSSPIQGGLFTLPQYEVIFNSKKVHNIPRG